MAEWKEYKLGDLCDVRGGKRLPKGELLVSYDTGHPYIRVTDLGNKWIAKDGLLFVEPHTQKGIARYTVNSGDVILSIVGSIGVVGRISRSLDNANLTENCVKFLVNSKALDKDYLYYFLISKVGQAEIEKGVVGSTQPKLPLYNIKGINISLPLLPEQQAIAEVLSSLDDKIDLLHRQNKTLEALAETLFRQWFVEEAEDSGEEVDLEAVTERITDGSHYSPPTTEIGLPMASVKDMHQWGIHTESCRYISKEHFEELARNDCRPLKNDILIAKDGSYLKHVFVAPEDLDIVILSSIAILRPNGKYHPLLLTIFLKMESTRNALENIVTGAVIPRIVLKDFRKFKILLPPLELQNKAVEIIEPIYSKCWANIKQIHLLTTLRNTLLPKLISGEVRVDIGEAETAIASQ